MRLSVTFLRRGLAYDGYQVDTALDGHTGLLLAWDNPPDLVVLDWMLPGMDGLEVCRRLRSAAGLPDLDADRQRYCFRPGAGAGCRGG